MEQLKILNKQYMYQEILSLLKKEFKEVTFEDYISIIAVLD